MNKEVLFSYFSKLTFPRYQALLAHFSSLEDAWKASDAAYAQLPWKKDSINEFLSWRRSIDEKRIADTLESEGIQCITINDSTYPPLLKQIYDPPICLFVRGTLNHIRHPIAVVGPRKFSAYGKMVTQTLVQELAKTGITIISGLALGIDALAHQATLTQQGVTVAVLGGGVDQRTLYPRLHIQLAQKIIENGGALISEYPPETLPTKYTFPKRNRIIAGLSLGTLVIEAAEKSGSLITAQCSADMGREVFAVPQNITSETSKGVHALIQQGAHMVTKARDIIDILGIETEKQIAQSRPTLSAEEQQICQYLSRDPVHIDELVKKTKMPSAKLTSNLTLLELHGRVKNLGNMTYILFS